MDYPKCSDGLYADERAAQTNKDGVWNGKSMRPWIVGDKISNFMQIISPDELVGVYPYARHCQS